MSSIGRGSEIVGNEPTETSDGRFNIDALANEPALRNYHLLPSVRGDLLKKLGRLVEARTEIALLAAVVATLVLFGIETWASIKTLAPGELAGSADKSPVMMMGREGSPYFAV